MNMPLKARSLERPEASHPQTPESGVSALPTPVGLRQQLPVSPLLSQQVHQHRQAIRQVLGGEADRTLVVVGPCSIHDEEAALAYGERLARLADEVGDRLLLVMRAYLEKPRTSVGWKGLLYDPRRTGAGDVNEGLQRSRSLLLSLAQLGLPLATEALSPMAMDYLDDLVSWTAIGARTTESQIHREMASGLPMPVGFKNSTDGSLGAAFNAMTSAAHSHHRLGQTRDGLPAMLTTRGNPDTHLVLRGGRGITNYDAESIAGAVHGLAGAGLSPAIMVDCSHDNACKQAQRQLDIARQVMQQRQAGNVAIRGLMLESFLQPGRQNDEGVLAFGQSITDPCLGWDETESLLRELARA